MPAVSPDPDGAPPPSASAAPGGLLRVLGVGFGLAGAVGGTIGAGILRTPGLVAAALGTAPLVLGAWLLGGLYALLGAVCVAEMAAALPEAGGWTVYARRAFGPLAGFTVGWIDWIGHCVGLAWVAITLGEYGLALLPASLTAGCPLVAVRAIAIGALALFALIQLVGVRAGGASLQLLSLAKAVAFLALVAACFLIGVPAGTEAGAATATVPAPVAPAGMAALALAAVPALQAVITTYDGWHSPIYFAEEFEDAPADLPRSLIGGLLAVLAIYLLVNLALLHVLPPATLASSSLPAADAARLLAGSAGARAITGLALLSLLGLIGATTMGAPRILYGLAEAGLTLPALATVNAGGTPTVAVLLTAAAGAVLVMAGDFSRLLGIAAVIYVALYATGIVCLIVLRRLEPELPRPFRAWGWPWSAGVMLAGSLAFLVGAVLESPGSSAVAMALMAVGVPIHLITRPDASGGA
ncbi:APC family permease [Cyanobium sp. FGCU-6]|nr:APC family permease [Cyanobium sp. FGCU6]